MAKESGGRVHAVSRAGAAGPLQFMPHTGRRFGLGVEQGFDLRFDPAAAARANVAYLNEQFALLNRNLELALAAYNGGEGRVQRLVRQARDKRFWSPEIFHRLPRETREYVPYVLAAAWLFMHPERYGLEFAPAAGGEERVRLERPASLSELAICLGQEGSRNGWFRVLRNLNPRHDPHRRL
ncbi:MAG: transglycosylase SLT domain-containing protein, partial [Myxococcales bacterium]|nr:transglycosylase SLT domain-containing protein [Myxococcales bacterium]